MLQISVQQTKPVGPNFQKNDVTALGERELESFRAFGDIRFRIIRSKPHFFPKFCEPAEPKSKKVRSTLLLGLQ